MFAGLFKRSNLINSIECACSCARLSSTRASSSTDEIPYWLNVFAPLRTVTLIPGADASEDVSSVMPSVVKRDDKPPAVTKILKESEDDEAFFRLMRWRKKMIRELGAEGFERLNRETLNRGLSFHSIVHTFLEERQEPDWLERISPKSLRLFKSALPELRKVEKYVTGEVFSTNPALFYRGKVDTIVVIDGQLTLMEWKTSTKPKPNLSSTYDAPIQAAAYVGALNRDPDLILPPFESHTSSSHINDRDLSAASSSSLAAPPLFVPSKPTITRAKIVVCYDDGSPATVHELPIRLLEDYWKTWRERLITYWIKTLTAKPAAMRDS